MHDIKFYINCKYEELHRYVFDYVYQSKNTDFDSKSKYYKANRNNKLEKYNNLIAWFYNFLKPIFKGWRKQIKEYSKLKNEKFVRYEDI